MNTRGITPRSAISTIAITTPPATDSSIIRLAEVLAASPSPAPRLRPTITWPAIAIASSTSASRLNICMPI